MLVEPGEDFQQALEHGRRRLQAEVVQHQLLGIQPAEIAAPLRGALADRLVVRVTGIDLDLRAGP